jgi:hypothetical protein
MCVRARVGEVFRVGGDGGGKGTLLQGAHVCACLCVCVRVCVCVCE